MFPIKKTLGQLFYHRSEVDLSEDLESPKAANSPDPDSGGSRHNLLLKREKTCKIRGAFKNGSSRKRVTDEEALTERIHGSIWPRSDLALFGNLVGRFPAELNTKHGNLDDTPLHKASRYGKQRFVRLLLDRGADVFAKNANGRTALHLAALGGHFEVTSMLCNAEADVNIGDDKGDAPIHLACKGGSMPVLKLVMEYSLCKMGCEGHLGNSLLHYAAQFGNLEMMSYIMESGTPPDIRNFLGETPLHLAAGAHIKKGVVDHLQILLDHGAGLGDRNFWGDTAAHYAARGGTIEALRFLVNQGAPMAKPEILPGEGMDGTSEDTLKEKHNLTEEFCDDMRLTLLQKVAKSACIVKSNYVLGEMMNARSIMAINQARSLVGARSTSQPYSGSTGPRELQYFEMSEQLCQFKRMSHELRSKMEEKNSALRLFLRHCPNSIEFFLDKCLYTLCQDQIQGAVYYDFFMFFSPDHHGDEAGELTFLQLIIEAGKEKFLMHPLIEVFVRLKWYKTFKMYLFIIATFFVFMVSLVMFTIDQFGGGRPLEQKSNGRPLAYREHGPFSEHSEVLVQLPTTGQRNFWWYFLAVTSSYMLVAALLRILYLLVSSKATEGWKAWTRSERDTLCICDMIFENIKNLSMPLLSSLVLYCDLDDVSKRYCMAIAVIISFHTFMLALGRLPKIGLYIFMLNKVFSTIFWFFVAYCWHFFGYAIAFHILMPENGAFSSLGSSSIKVLTMLMGEYDFTDNFDNAETFWLSKILFVCFVVDMSVVLMNLVLGLAVNDVDSILRDSKVRRMVHETRTVTHLEKFYMELYKLPLLNRCCYGVRIATSNSCTHREVFFLDLIDVVHNKGNRIVIDRTLTGGQRESFPVQAEITKEVVKIIKKRLSSSSNLNPDEPSSSTLRVSEVRETYEALSTRMEAMEQQMRQLVDIMKDMQSKKEEKKEEDGVKILTVQS